MTNSSSNGGSDVGSSGSASTSNSDSNVKDLFKELVKKRQEIAAFAQIEALLYWDQTVMMPPKGAAARAQQLAACTGVSHDRKTAPELGSILDKLKPVYEKTTELDEREKAVVRDSIREFNIETAIPRELATKLAKLGSDAYDAWAKAKAAKDFSIFKPFLQDWINAVNEKAKHIDPTRPVYDVLMDKYERGLKSTKVDEVFAEIKAVLIPLIAKIQQRPKPNMEFLQQEFDVKIQAKVSEQISKELGYDTERGRLDVSVHPFTVTVGATTDVRITSRYNAKDLAVGVTATIHETGHALYEQGLRPDFAAFPGGTHVSMGIHESQSLFWERMVGKGEFFWQKYWDLFKQNFPSIPASSTGDDFYRAINYVHPSTIRVEADELTYPLHIILRYEIEQGLISGKIPVDDNLPKLWNQKMQEYLGITIENDAEGILQDVHWSMGYYGYFPTYTLGAIWASQFYKTAKEKIPDLEQQIAKGEFATLKKWLNENIHEIGALYPTGDDVSKLVTGDGLNAKIFTEYLTTKYSKLYGL